MKGRYIFFFVFLAAVTVRAILNFSTPLVPGLGGGYNLVQIRAIVENGHLAFPDMPVLFYLNAGIVKLLLGFFPGLDPGQLIINVSKGFDTIGFPLLLFPLYRIYKLLIHAEIPALGLLTVASFAVLSFSPLDLACDAQKNSLALSMMMFFVLFFLEYLQSRSPGHLVISIGIWILIALTHFGVFAITLLFIIIALILYFGWKSVLPIVGVVLTGGVLIAFFDSDRALSLLTFWGEAFSIFPSPRIMHYPYWILNFLFSLLLVVLLIRILRGRRTDIDRNERKVMLILLLFISVLAFPFYGFEYGRRLGLMLVVPQAVALLLLLPYLDRQAATVLSCVVLALVLLTVSFRLIQPKPLAITEESYAELQGLETMISDPDHTLVFARHGLEWWVAWELRVKIASANLEVDQEMLNKYDHIFYLVQKKGENLIYPGKTSIFIQPVVHDNAEIVYDSQYFEMYEIKPAG